MELNLASIKYKLTELQHNKRMMWMVILCVMAVIVVIYRLAPYVSTLFNQDAALEELRKTKEAQLADLQIKRGEQVNAFLKTYGQSRSLIIVGDKSAADLGVQLENDVRDIANISGFEFTKMGPCRFNRISETLEAAEIPVTATARWKDILLFMADVDNSRPRFVWQSLTIARDRSGLLLLNGTLKGVVVKDQNLINVLVQLPAKETPMYNTTHDIYAVEPDPALAVDPTVDSSLAVSPDVDTEHEQPELSGPSDEEIERQIRAAEDAKIDAELDKAIAEQAKRQAEAEAKAKAEAEAEHAEPPRVMPGGALISDEHSEEE